MAIISCPECSKQVSDASSACVGCGFPIGAIATQRDRQPTAVSYDRRGADRLPACSNCGADGYRKLSLVHANGLSLTNATTAGVGMTLGGGVGIGAAKSAGTAQTVLSAKASPPQKKSVSGWALIGILLGLAWIGAGTSGDGSLAIVGVVVLVGIGVYIYAIISYNQKQYPGEYAKWDRSFMCERCGNVAEL